MYKPYIVTCKRCERKFAASSRKVKLCSQCKPKPKPKKRVKYPKAFRDAAPFVRIRDNWTCQNCHKPIPKDNPTDPLPPVHHIDFNINNNDTKNLVTLCRSCYLNIHKNGYKFFRVKRIVIPKEPEVVRVEPHPFRNIKP